MTANDLVFSLRRPEETEFCRQVGKSSPQGPSAGHCALIVSDTLAVVFIDAHLGAPSPYGQLSEAAPPRLEGPQGSAATPAETGTGPSYRVGAVHHHRPAARFRGGAWAHGVRRNLHRAPSTVLAAVAARHRERTWRRRGVRSDAWIPPVSKGTVHGIPIGSDRGTGDGSKPLRGSCHRGKPGRSSRNCWPGIEPASASRNASADSDPVTGIVSGRPMAWTPGLGRDEVHLAGLDPAAAHRRLVGY